MVAVDETKIKLNGLWVYLWAAIDVEGRKGG
jgi:transposase-like protein